MEQLKKLSVNTSLCDMTEITEELLSAYSEININAATVLLSDRSSILISRHPVKINAASSLKFPEGINVVLKNGSVEIDGTDNTTEQTCLMVNGTLLLYPTAENVMDNYVQITVNGSLIYPKNLSGYMSRIQLNGSQKCYPDNAVCILKDLTVDKFFIIRAAQNTPYFVTGQVKILDPELDLTPLINKNVSFLCSNALIMENFFEQSLSLFDENTDILIIPDGFRLLPENMELNNAVLTRLGKKLFRNGNLYITEKSILFLSALESLKITGTLYIPEKFADELYKFPLEYDRISIIRGTLISDRSTLYIDKQLLEQTPDGLHVMNCATVEIDKNISPQLARGHLYLENCAIIKCSPELKKIIELISSDIAAVLNSEDLKDCDEKNNDTIYVNTASYKF